MRIEEAGSEITLTYDSLSDLAKSGLKHLPTYLAGRTFWAQSAWFGVDSESELKELAYKGWQTESAEALDIAEQAIEHVERDFHMPGFQAVWDVAGCEVDVARYLAKEPENMIDYELVPTTRAGRVIVLCASISYSTAISAETIKRRGHGVAALAFALTKLGYATELWVDLSATGKENGKRMSMRVLVKGPNDALDPAMIMFAFSHPAMLRALGLPAMHEMPEKWQGWLGAQEGGSYGRPSDPLEDLPDGTIYLPSVRAFEDVPEAYDMLLAHMRLLGIIND